MQTINDSKNLFMLDLKKLNCFKTPSHQKRFSRRPACEPSHRLTQNFADLELPTAFDPLLKIGEFLLPNF